MEDTFFCKSADTFEINSLDHPTQSSGWLVPQSLKSEGNFSKDFLRRKDVGQ